MVNTFFKKKKTPPAASILAFSTTAEYLSLDEMQAIKANLLAKVTTWIEGIQDDRGLVCTIPTEADMSKYIYQACTKTGGDFQYHAMVKARCNKRRCFVHKFSTTSNVV